MYSIKFALPYICEQNVFDEWVSNIYIPNEYVEFIEYYYNYFF